MSGIDREIILDLRHIAKHLPDTTQVQRLLRRGRSSHIFSDEVTMDIVAQAIMYCYMMSGKLPVIKTLCVGVSGCPCVSHNYG